MVRLTGARLVEIGTGNHCDVRSQGARPGVLFAELGDRAGDEGR
jgi:hypothetical protein